MPPADPDAEYPSDGIPETLMNSLAQLRKIRIVPSSIAFRNRGPDVDPLRVGRELGVRAVLAGRMMQRGEDLIVSLELVDVDRQARVWGGRYNRKMTDLLALQEELTTEISDKLRLELTGEEKRKLRKRPAQNDEAYRLLLRAVHHAGRMTPEGLRKAIALCLQAVDIDPTCAAAYSYLSSAYGNLAFFGCAPALYPLTVAAAKKSIELDDSLPEAARQPGLRFHTNLGFCDRSEGNAAQRRAQPGSAACAEWADCLEPVSRSV
jgi:TolB-like protein